MGDVSSTNVLCDKLKVGENNVLMELTENSDKGSKSIMVPRTGGYYMCSCDDIIRTRTVVVTRISSFSLKELLIYLKSGRLLASLLSGEDQHSLKQSCF